MRIVTTSVLDINKKEQFKNGKDLMFQKIVIQTIHILNSASKINKLEYTY